MSRETGTLETLDRRIAELASFVSPSEIFRALLEGTVVGAPCAALFLMRDGQWKGWSSMGYSAAATQSQRRTTAPADSGWLAALAAEEDVRWRSLALLPRSSRHREITNALRRAPHCGALWCFESWMRTGAGWPRLPSRYLRLAALSATARTQDSSCRRRRNESFYRRRHSA